jgi:hypothetical protein
MGGVMPSSLRKLLVGCACVLLTHAAYPAPLTPEQKIHVPLNALLERYCPAKHLEFLAPADFNDAVDPFRTSLPSATRTQLDQTADPRKACADTIAGTTAGTSCANLAFIKAATRLKLLPLFAKKLCTLPLACRGESECS